MVADEAEGFRLLLTLMVFTSTNGYFSPGPIVVNAALKFVDFFVVGFVVVVAAPFCIGFFV